MKTWETIPRRWRASYKSCPTCSGPMAKHARQCQRCSVHIMRLERHVFWKGDAARAETKRERIQKRLSLEGVTCERCAAVPATDRHHIDSDPGNSALSNIACLCRRCHMVVDGRLAAFRAVGRRFTGGSAATESEPS